MKVRAIKRGFAQAVGEVPGGVQREPGDVFDVPDDTPLGTWLERVPDDTPLRRAASGMETRARARAGTAREP